MLYKDFIRCLSERPRTPWICVSALAELINLHHFGVGRVIFKRFENVQGAQPGGFIWLDEDRTSPHEEPFNDACVFVNDKYADDRPLRRLICAKELMHVFDTHKQQVRDRLSFENFINQIASEPVFGDTSPQYRADRDAYWKAAIALVPPWIRSKHITESTLVTAGSHKVAEKLVLPPQFVEVVLRPYYETAAARFLGPAWASVGQANT